MFGAKSRGTPRFPGCCPASGGDSGLESQASGRCPLERSKCWPSLGMSGKPEEASVSSGLPGVNVQGGWRSTESGSHTRAKVQEEAPGRKERPGQSLQSGCVPAPTHLPGGEGPWKTLNVYLFHLELPLAFSSRRVPFCHGCWGRGTPCSRHGTRPQSHRSGDVENVLGHSDWAPGC